MVDVIRLQTEMSSKNGLAEEIAKREEKAFIIIDFLPNKILDRTTKFVVEKFKMVR